MVPATDSALKSPTCWVWIWVGLGLCATDSGCARMQPFRDDRPMLGAVGLKPGSLSLRGNDLYAEHVGPGVARSRMLLAQEAARSQAAKTPMGVALQPPVTVPTVSDTPPLPDSPPALASNPAPESAPKPDAKPSATSEAAPSAPAPTLESILAETRARLDGLTSYQVPITRQERVGSTLQDSENVLLSLRRNPKAVRLEWRDGPHKNREVIYVSDEPGGKMHVKMVGPLPPITIAVDSPMVLQNSRHPVTEAGFDTIIGNLELTHKLSQSGDESRGRLSYAGIEDVGPPKQPCHKIIRVTPAGETWMIFIDTETKLPTMVQANAANGELLERYNFGAPKLDLPELAAADAFDPDRRWRPTPGGGLLQRLARANAAKPIATTPR